MKGLQLSALVRGFASGFVLLGSLGVATTQAQDGSIVAFGANSWGQCTVPLPNEDFVAGATGGEWSLGLKSDGTIVAWGYNGNGGQCEVPAPNADFVAVAAGYDHGLGLKSDGTIVAWGNNGNGQCTVPSPNADFVAVAGGAAHSLGLKSDGAIAAWGYNYYGQCDVPSPNADFVAVAGGGYHSLGVKSDGTIVAWGNNEYGQCTVPMPNVGFRAVSAGCTHSLGITPDGTVVAWGSNTYGECDVPAPNADFVAIAGSWVHNLSLKSDGTIVAWGYDDSRCDVPLPNAGFVAVSGGSGGHSLGVKGSLLGGACCHNNAACTYTIQEHCLDPAEWQGLGTTCNPNSCPPSGACCEPTGLCTLVPAGSCPETGVWQGAGTACNPTPCLSGACCLRSAPGTCLILPPTDCASYNGFYFGNGTLCAPSDTCLTTGVGGTSPGVSRIQLLTSPNPSASGVVIRCRLALHALTTLDLFDATGRMVRRLHDGDLPAGETQFSWDGRDDTGREVAAGVYLVKVTTPAGQTSGRAVLAR